MGAAARGSRGREGGAAAAAAKPATPPPPPPANTTCFVAVVGFDHARGNVLEWAFPGAEAAWSESLPFAALPDGAHHVAAGKGEVCRFAVVREDKSRLYGCSCVMQAAPDELTGRAKAQATRSRVQKAVCVLHTSRDVAWSARLGSRIEACAAALFAGGDLDDRGLLRDFHSSVREMKAGEPATHLFDACARLGFAGALRCVKALALGHALTFVHAKSVCAAPDAALAFADVLYAFDEDNESVDSVAVFGRELSTQMRIEPAVALMDLDRVVSEGDEFQVIAGTANAHLAEAGLGPRLAPCVVARLEADAPKASRVRAFGPSQYASSAVCRLTPVEEALAAELDERAAKVFQRATARVLGTTTSGRSTRCGLICGTCWIASLPVHWCRGPRRGMWWRIGNLPATWRGATAGPSWRRSWTRRRRCAFWAQRNPALADWLAVADAPTLARSFDPSLADRIGFARLHVREATKDLTVDDALASGQKALTNVAAQLTNVGAGLQPRLQERRARPGPSAAATPARRPRPASGPTSPRTAPRPPLPSPSRRPRPRRRRRRPGARAPRAASRRCGAIA